MPKYWYDIVDARKKDEEDGTNGLQERICVHKRPYFMTYVYPEYRSEYTEYAKNIRKKCKRLFKISYENLQKKKRKTKKMQDFIQKVQRFEPFGLGACTMNEICWYIEKEFKGYQSVLKKKSSFDYRTLMKNASRQPDKYFDISDLIDSHQRMLEAIRDDDDKAAKKAFLMRSNREDALKICPDADELADIVIALTYGQNKNQEICWGYCGKVICNRLRELK